MDRKSIIILVVSFVLLVSWFPIMNKVYPPKPLPTRQCHHAASAEGGGLRNSGGSGGRGASAHERKRALHVYLLRRRIEAGRIGQISRNRRLPQQAQGKQAGVAEHRRPASSARLVGRGGIGGGRHLCAQCERRRRSRGEAIDERTLPNEGIPARFELPPARDRAPGKSFRATHRFAVPGVERWHRHPDGAAG